MYDSGKTAEEGEVHSAAAPCDCRSLREAFMALKRHAAPGVDGVTWQNYEAGLEGNLLTSRTGPSRRIRALPVRRRFIPKPGVAASVRDRGTGGQNRPARDRHGAQRDLRGGFLGFSYGFRPGRSQHDALDALSGGDLRYPSELDTRCRHPKLLRCGQPRLADPLPGTSDR